jgi:hypothetical protein
MTEWKERDRQIAKRARELWVEEGKPEGRDEAFKDMAAELIAIEESQTATLVPADRGEPVEPPEAFENQAEFPGLTDQGEGANGPRRSNQRDPA